jgi:hypothetical protein
MRFSTLLCLFLAASMQTVLTAPAPGEETTTTEPATTRQVTTQANPTTWRTTTITKTVSPTKSTSAPVTISSVGINPDGGGKTCAQNCMIKAASSVGCNSL